MSKTHLVYTKTFLIIILKVFPTVCDRFLVNENISLMFANKLILGLNNHALMNPIAKISTTQKCSFNNNNNNNKNNMTLIISYPSKVQKEKETIINYLN